MIPEILLGVLLGYIIATLLGFGSSTEARPPLSANAAAAALVDSHVAAAFRVPAAATHSPITVLSQRWQLPLPVAKALTGWLDLIIRDFVIPWYRFDGAGGGLSADGDFLLVAQSTLVNMVGQLAFRMGHVHPLEFLIDDLSSALLAHLTWYNTMAGRAAARSPELFDDDVSDAHLLAAARRRLGAPAPPPPPLNSAGAASGASGGGAGPAPARLTAAAASLVTGLRGAVTAGVVAASGAVGAASAAAGIGGGGGADAAAAAAAAAALTDAERELIVSERRVREELRERAILAEYAAQPGVLHPACDATEQPSVLGAAPSARSAANNPPPWAAVLPPSAHARMSHCRAVAEQVLRRLLPAGEADARVQGLLLREVLACRVVEPLLSNGEPHSINLLWLQVAAAGRGGGGDGGGGAAAVPMSASAVGATSSGGGSAGRDDSRAPARGAVAAVSSTSVPAGARAPGVAAVQQRASVDASAIVPVASPAAAAPVAATGNRGARGSGGGTLRGAWGKLMRAAGLRGPELQPQATRVPSTGKDGDALGAGGGGGGGSAPASPPLAQRTGGAALAADTLDFLLSSVNPFGGFGGSAGPGAGLRRRRHGGGSGGIPQRLGLPLRPSQSASAGGASSTPPRVHSLGSSWPAAADDEAEAEAEMEAGEDGGHEGGEGTAPSAGSDGETGDDDGESDAGSAAVSSAAANAAATSVPAPPEPPRRRRALLDADLGGESLFSATPAAHRAPAPAVRDVLPATAGSEGSSATAGDRAAGAAISAATHGSGATASDVAAAGLPSTSTGVAATQRLWRAGADAWDATTRVAVAAAAAATASTRSGAADSGGVVGGLSRRVAGAATAAGAGASSALTAAAATAVPPSAAHDASGERRDSRTHSVASSAATDHEYAGGGDGSGALHAAGGAVDRMPTTALVSAHRALRTQSRKWKRERHRQTVVERLEAAAALTAGARRRGAAIPGGSERAASSGAARATAPTAIDDAWPRRHSSDAAAAIGSGGDDDGAEASDDLEERVAALQRAAADVALARSPLVAAADRAAAAAAERRAALRHSAATGAAARGDGSQSPSDDATTLVVAPDAGDDDDEDNDGDGGWGGREPADAEDARAALAPDGRPALGSVAAASSSSDGAPPGADGAHGSGGGVAPGPSRASLASLRRLVTGVTATTSPPGTARGEDAPPPPPAPQAPRHLLLRCRVVAALKVRGGGGGGGGAEPCRVKSPPKGGYRVEYEIAVSVAGLAWRVRARYSALHALHTRIKDSGAASPAVCALFPSKERLRGVVVRLPGLRGAGLPGRGAPARDGAGAGDGAAGGDAVPAPATHGASGGPPTRSVFGGGFGGRRSHGEGGGSGGGEFDPAFVLRRLRALDAWLQAVVAARAVSESRELREFLAPPPGTRVRRVARSGDGDGDGGGGGSGGGGGGGRRRGADGPPSASPIRFGGGTADVPSTTGGRGAQRRVTFASAAAAASSAASAAGAQGGSGATRGGASPPPPPVHRRGTDALALPSSLATATSDAAAPTGPAAPVAAGVARFLTASEVLRAEAALFAVLDVAFRLQGQGWIRRQLISTVRALARLVFHGAGSARRLGAAYLRAVSPPSLASAVRWARELLWPGGTLRVFEGVAPWAEQRAARDDALRLLLRAPPPALATLLGRDATAEGLERVFASLQLPILARSLTYTLFDLLLLRLFPSIAVHGLGGGADAGGAGAAASAGGAADRGEPPVLHWQPQAAATQAHTRSRHRHGGGGGHGSGGHAPAARATAHGAAARGGVVPVRST